MNVIKRRWPDLLIGLLVLLLLIGFAALLLGRGGPGAGTTSSSGPAVPQPSSPQTQTPQTQTPQAQAPATQNPPPSTPPGSPDTQAAVIPTIPAAPVTDAGTATPGGTTPPTTKLAPQPAVATPATPDAAPRVGGAVAASETRTPTRNDYRISLGSYSDQAAVQAATAGVSKLGYTVYPIAVASGVVAQVGPFATREAAAQALADIQRALPKALLYPPRNAPASNPASSSTSSSTGNSTGNSSGNPVSTANSAASAAAPTVPAPASGSALAASGPVYLQVGAYNSTTAAQTAVARVRDLGLEPSVNAPAGKLVTVVVGPFQGQALVNAEARLQAGGINSFRVR